VLLKARERLLADTSMFCRFAEHLGEAGLVALLDHFESTLCITTDVSRELAGHVKGQFPRLACLQWVDLVRHFTRSEPLALTPSEQAAVIRIAQSWPRANPHSVTAHEGEIATVLLAAREQHPVVIDDRDGQRLARARGVELFTTRDVIAEMVACGRLPEQDGCDAWCQVFKDRRSAADFHRAVDAVQV
jgi:hypothetical protein